MKLSTTSRFILKQIGYSPAISTRDSCTGGGRCLKLDEADESNFRPGDIPRHRRKWLFKLMERVKYFHPKMVNADGSEY